MASGRTNCPKALWICTYAYVIFRGGAQPFTNAPGAFNLKQALDATRKKNEVRKVRHGKLKEKSSKICKTQVANKILSATLINMLFTKFILSILTRR